MNISVPEEAWLPVVGYEESYEVSNLGRVKSVARVVMRRNGTQQSVRERIRVQIPHRGQYLQVVLSADGVRVTHKAHRLVAAAFLGPEPEGEEVRHLNGDGMQNNLDNLRYGTKKDNAADKLEHGRSNRGERSAHAKITEADVLEIRRMTIARVPHSEIAKQFGIRQPQVSRIASGKRWGWLRG
jgi:hypothetical protein